MSCDSIVAAIATPPQEMSLFEEDWKSCIGDDSLEGLDAIAEFNASFDVDNDAGYIDPNLLSKASSEAATHGSLFDGDGNNMLEPTLNALDTSTANTAYPRPSTPYFHPSIELATNNFQPIPPPHAQHHYNPSQFHQALHRRSVSEPPTGPNPNTYQHEHYQPSPGTQTQIFFHRQGHYLGKPQAPARTQTAKSRMRFHPYPAHGRGGAKMKRAQPTSVPLVEGLGGLPAPRLEVGESVQMSPLQYVSTRICTPTPSPERELSPVNRAIVDPCVEKEGWVSIPMTVERLQEMITEAVKKAMKEDVVSEVVGEVDGGDVEIGGEAVETVEGV